jgi:hypothetical protein
MTQTVIEPNPMRPERQRGGRPSKLTAQVLRKILRGIGRGMPMTHAVTACGLTYQSFLNYRRSHPKVDEILKRAVSRGINQRLAVIEECMKSGDLAIRLRSSIWWLEHAPGAAEHYSKTRLEVTGSDGLPMSVSIYLPKKEGSEIEAGEVVDTTEVTERIDNGCNF